MSDLLGLIRDYTSIRKIKLSNDSFENRMSTIDELYNSISSVKKEVLFVLGYDDNKQLAELYRIKRGNEYCIDMNRDANDLLRKLVYSECSNFVFTHNHPSGNPLPSFEDDKFTIVFNLELRRWNKRLLDHVIWTEKSLTSMRNTSDVFSHGVTA